MIELSVHLAMLKLPYSCRQRPKQPTHRPCSWLSLANYIDPEFWRTIYSTYVFTNPMPIFYSLIARGKTVLAEYTDRSGNFPTVTRVLLSKISPEDQRMSYAYDQCVLLFWPCRSW